MRYNVDDNVSKKLVELEIKNKKQMLTLYDGIIETLAKFDNKPITKRIETALKKNVSKHITVKRDYNSFIINYWFDDRSVNINSKWYYLKNDYGNFVHACCHSSYNDGVLNYGDIKETLNFENLKTQLLIHKEYIEKNIKEMENNLKNIDKLIKEYEDIRKKCKEFNSNVGYSIAEYYGIKRFDIF